MTAAEQPIGRLPYSHPHHHSYHFLLWMCTAAVVIQIFRCLRLRFCLASFVRGRYGWGRRCARGLEHAGVRTLMDRSRDADTILLPSLAKIAWCTGAEWPRYVLNACLVSRSHSCTGKRRCDWSVRAIRTAHAMRCKITQARHINQPKQTGTRTHPHAPVRVRVHARACACACTHVRVCVCMRVHRQASGGTRHMQVADEFGTNQLKVL